jgi:acyl-CoA synthetase (AMP-forming)/AMP-acid ligase II
VGFLAYGELYIAGRLKDLLIVRGRNIHPHDVEDAGQRVDARLRQSRGVACQVETADGEGVALIQETTVRDSNELRTLAERVRQAVFDLLQVAISEVYFVPPKAVLKTSSGKLRRRATHDALRAGKLHVLYRWSSNAEADVSAAAFSATAETVVNA